MVNVESLPSVLDTEQSTLIATRYPSYCNKVRQSKIKCVRSGDKVMKLYLYVYFLHTHSCICRKVNMIIKKIVESILRIEQGC